MPLTITRRKAFLAGSAFLGAQAAQNNSAQVERWGMFEAAFTGPETGNPFLEVSFSAQFRREHRTINVDGFYDGGGVYKVRFMPDSEGEWSYTTRSGRAELNGKA